MSNACYRFEQEKQKLREERMRGDHAAILAQIDAGQLSPDQILRERKIKEEQLDEEVRSIHRRRYGIFAAGFLYLAKFCTCGTAA